MSYILDALRRSEKERKSDQTPAHHSGIRQSSGPLPPSAWPLIVGVIVLFSLAISLLVFTHGLNKEVAVLPVSDPAEVVAPKPIVPDVPVPIQAEKNVTAPEIPPLKEAVPEKPPIRDLAEQAQVAPPKVVHKPEAMAIAPPPKKLSAPIPRTAQAVPAATEEVPLLREKSEDFRRHLPDMAVTIHVYLPDETQRILFINNREYHKGDQVGDGVRIEEIVEDGVVLSYAGERFKLDRPR